MTTAKKAPAKKSAAKKSAAKKSAGTKAPSKTAGKKTPAKKAPAKKSSSEQTCWPGFEPTPGMSAGEKGSCKPKKTQTKSEKKGDAKAAAASKQEK